MSRDPKVTDTWKVQDTIKKVQIAASKNQRSLSPTACSLENLGGSSTHHHPHPKSIKRGIKMFAAYRVFLAPNFREIGVVTYAPHDEGG